MKSTPAAPANAPATPIIFCCPWTPTGAAAAELWLAAPLPLALACELAALVLELELRLELCEAEVESEPAPVAEAELMVLSSVGSVVLNSSVMGTSGARDVLGVFVPTMLVSACCELGSRESLETATLKGSPQDDELWALLSPMRERTAEFLRTARRIIVNLEVLDPDG